MNIQNKKATFDYSLEEFFDAGIILVGNEIKSIAKNKATLVGGYVVIENEEMFLIGLHIIDTIEPDRKKKLLLTKSEIKKLLGKVQQKGYTIVATELFMKNGKVKVKINLAKGKTKFDKRESLKNKDIDRNIDQIIKSNSKL